VTLAVDYKGTQELSGGGNTLLGLGEGLQKHKQVKIKPSTLDVCLVHFHYKAVGYCEWSSR
jgi:hypothetical protein